MNFLSLVTGEIKHLLFISCPLPRPPASVVPGLLSGILGGDPGVLSREECGRVISEGERIDVVGSWFQ